MSVPNCDVGVDYTRGPYPVFKSAVLPNVSLPGPSPTMLNPDCISTKYQPDFYESECDGLNPQYSFTVKQSTRPSSVDISRALKPLYKAVKETAVAPGDKHFKNTTYVANDPRLVDVARGGYYMHLDVPPITGEVKLKDIYSDPVLDNYGKPVYRDYEDIKAGQVLYYVDPATGPPLIEPIFTNPAQTTGWLMQDPMGALKPYYCRKPLVYTNVYDTDHYKPGELTWIRDSQESREDIMALQMDLMNRQKYSARWQ